jgi:hypothetical protein
MGKLSLLLLITALSQSLVGCDADDGGATTHPYTLAGKITSFETQECYCCASVTIETDTTTYFVDTFPDYDLKESDLPKDVVISITGYTGKCPNRNADVWYH